MWQAPVDNSLNPCRVVENGTLDAFWDTISFGFNGLVFFFAGASATNFAWRSTQVSFAKDRSLCPALSEHSLPHPVSGVLAKSVSTPVP